MSLVRYTNKKTGIQAGKQEVDQGTCGGAGDDNPGSEYMV